MQALHRTGLLAAGIMCGTLALTSAVPAAATDVRPGPAGQAPVAGVPDQLRRTSGDAVKAIDGDRIAQRAAEIVRECDATMGRSAEQTRQCDAVRGQVATLTRARTELAKQSAAAQPDRTAVEGALTDSNRTRAEFAHDGSRGLLSVVTGLLGTVTGLVPGLLQTVGGTATGLLGTVTGLVSGLLGTLTGLLGR